MSKEMVIIEGSFRAEIVFYKEEYLSSFDKVYGLTGSEVIDYLVFISKVMNILEELKKEIKS